MASEKLFENRVKKWLHSQGIYAAGTPSNKMDVDQTGWFVKVWGGGYMKAGIPDVLLCVNGFFLAVELKGESGRASELQELNTKRINAANGIGVILYPKGLDAFKELVKGVMTCNSHTVALNCLKVAHTGSNCVILTS